MICNFESTPKSRFYKKYPTYAICERGNNDQIGLFGADSIFKIYIFSFSNMRNKMFYTIIFYVILHMTYCVKDNRMIFQDDSKHNYYKKINNFYNWSEYGSRPNTVIFVIDSSDVRYPTLFCQILKKDTVTNTIAHVNLFTREKFSMNLSIAWNSKLLLPYQQTFLKNAKISITYKSENLKYIKLVSTFFDESEKIILSDTLNATDNKTWSTCSKDIPLNGCRFFFLELIAEGIDSTYWNDSRGKVESTCNQYLWIDEIDIKFDGKSIRNFYEQDILPVCKINEKDIIPIVDENSFAHIPELNEKKIIAIGESAHGSEAFPELFVQMAKYLVKNSQCRLILLEQEMSMTLPLNSFIQGHECFDIDSLLYDIRYSSYSYHQMRELLLFLKEHNRTSEKKVFLMGIDFEVSVHHNLHAAKYLFTLNENYHIQKLDSICYDLITKDFRRIHDFSEFETTDWFREMISETELALFMYCLQHYLKLFVDNSFNYDEMLKPIKREEWMFENAKNLTDLICEDEQDSKVLIYGHSGHVNYLESNMHNSFGRYMKEFYGDQYSSICLLVNKGDFRGFNTPNTTKIDIIPLLQNERSIESALYNFSYDCMYVPVNALTIPHICTRHLGLRYSDNQFRIITPNCRYDAFIFRHRTDVANYLPEIIGSDGSDQLFEEWNNLHKKIEKKLKPYHDLNYYPF